MKRIDRAIAAVLAVSAWAGIVLVLVPGRGSVVGHVWLVLVLAIALGAALGALHRTVPRRVSAFDTAFAAVRRPRARPASLDRVEREVALATGTAFDVHYRLRPTLRSIASGLLLRRGVDIYCHPGPMMHAKTVVIDDRFAMVGSYNLDERSRAKNLEVNVAVEDVAFATYVRKWFDRDIAGANRIDLYEWRSRPLARRGIEYVAYALRKLW